MPSRKTYDQAEGPFRGPARTRASRTVQKGQRRRRLLRPLARTLLVLALILILATLLLGPKAHKAPVIASTFPKQVPGSLTSTPMPSGLAGKVLVEAEGTPLVSKDATRGNALASVTKIMTAYIVLTSGHYRLTQKIPITQAEVHEAQVMLLAGDSVVIFPTGSQVSVLDMLYALLLPSGDNIADLLAAAYPGGEGAFVAAMNAKARALGLTSLHYVDPSGLGPRDTGDAQDIVRLTALALKNPTFARIVATKSWTLPGVGTVHNLNVLLTDLPGTVGVKTGWTTASGRNLVWANRPRIPGSPLIIAAILGAPGGFGPVFNEASALTSYAKVALGRLVIPKGTIVGEATLGLGLKVPLRAARTITLWGPKGSPIHFRWIPQASPPGLPGRAMALVGATPVPVPLLSPKLPLWYRIAVTL